MINFTKKRLYIIIPILITIISLVSKCVIFSINDDYFMYLIANSYRTNMHSEQLVFISVIFGYILKFLYNIVPQINWFELLYLFGINIGLIPLFKIAQNGKSKLAFIFLIIVDIYVLFNLTFTVIAFICAASGVLWMLFNVHDFTKKNIPHMLFSLVLFFIAFGFRSGDLFFCILLMFIPTYFFAIKEKRNSAKVIIITLIMCICANYSITFIQNQYNKQIPSDTYYSEFQEYRSVLSDGGNFEYSNHANEIEKIGMSENDIELYYSYAYADKNVFNNESLEKLSNIRQLSEKYNFNILDVLKEMYLSASATKNFVLFYTTVALCLFILIKNRRKEIFLTSVFVLGAIFYLFFRRRGLERVYNPIAIIGSTTLFLILNSDLKSLKVKMLNDLKSKKINLKNSLVTKIVSIVLCVSVIVGYSYYLEKDSNVKESAPVVNALDTLEKDTEKNGTLYVSSSTTSNILFSNTSIYKTFTLNSNIPKNPINCVLGDWYVYTYYWYDYLNNLGLSDYKDGTIPALLKENVRLVELDPNIASKMKVFLYEHYNISANYKIVDSFPIENTNAVIYVYDFYVTD